MRRRKVCASDYVVAEMLQTLSLEGLEARLVCSMTCWQVQLLCPCLGDRWSASSCLGRLTRLSGLSSGRFLSCPRCRSCGTVLLDRLLPQVVDKISHTQFGFVPGKFTRARGVILLLQMLGEKANAFGIPAFFLSVDVHKAFGSVSHKANLLALQSFGVNPSLTGIICRGYNDIQGVRPGQTGET